jgi:hypothetical protein
MSRTRDGLNTAAMRLLGGRPPREVPQPLAVAAVANSPRPSASDAGGLAAWSGEIVVAATLTADKVYWFNATTPGWAELTPDVDHRAAIAVCTAVDTVADPDQSTLLLGGVFARSGTAGAPLYAGTAGAITETFPGDATDETTTAPWVWPIGWQITSTLAVFIPCDPYRPRTVAICLTDGETQLDLILRESPADPA